MAHQNPEYVGETEEVDKWADMDSNAWSDSITQPGSTFYELYQITSNVIEAQLARRQFDVIIEIGCGTGEVITALKTDLPRIGVDINPKFVATCEETARRMNEKNISFCVADATECMAWWHSISGHEKYSRPLLLCCNNTFNIMPSTIRYRVLQQLRLLAGQHGRIIVTYWNGDYFSHGVANYYLKNPKLCGAIDVEKHIDWKEQTLVSSTGYHTQWLHPDQVMRLLKSYDVDLKRTVDLEDCNCLFVKNLGVFGVFGAKTSGKRDYYDTSDMKTFYSEVYGETTMRIGKFEPLPLSPSGKVKNKETIQQAQESLMAEVRDVVATRAERCAGKVIPARYADLGCGFGGLLRGLARDGFVRNGYSIDFSYYMCESARKLDAEAGLASKIEVLNESFFDTSLGDESCDVVTSMDAFFLTGSRYKDLLKEAYRLLRPGGLMVITDITRRECYSTNPEYLQKFGDNMQKILKLYDVDQLSSVSEAERLISEMGFADFNYKSYSHNLTIYYSKLHDAFAEWRKTSKFSEEWCEEQSQFFGSLASLAGEHLDWGVYTFRKVR